MDLTANLSSLAFESGLSERESEQVLLRSRAAGLLVCGCAHAAFYCGLAAALRNKLNHIANKSTCLEELNIAILGGGRIGKQLASALLSVPTIKPSNIHISTRRPETLKEFSKQGIECYFDNSRLASGADVLFLCILPSHLVRLCAEIQSHLPSHCLVYSFTSAVPLPRLAQLLSHSNILKPQYEFTACDSALPWLRQKQIAACLSDQEILIASCPLSMTGGISLQQRWVTAVLYSLLNMCTAEGLKSNRTIQLLNEVFQTNLLTSNNFVNASCASTLTNPEKPFPWISLTDAQTKETPLSSYLSGCKALQDVISSMYLKTFSKFLVKHP